MAGEKEIALKCEKSIKPGGGIVWTNIYLRRINADVRQTNEKSSKYNKKRYCLYAKEQVARPKSKNQPNSNPQEKRALNYEKI